MNRSFTVYKPPLTLHQHHLTMGLALGLAHLLRRAQSATDDIAAAGELGSTGAMGSGAVARQWDETSDVTGFNQWL